MKKLITPMMAVALFLSFGVRAHADLIDTIVNPGFETPALADGAYTQFNTDNITGWDVVVGSDTQAFIFDPDSGNIDGSGTDPDGDTLSAGTTVEGENYLSLKPDDGTVVGQVISSTFAENTTYTLTVSVGDRSDAVYKGYTIKLGFNDGETTGAGTFSELATAFDAYDSGNVPESSFIDVNLSYTVPQGAPAIGQNIEIRLQTDPDSGTSTATLFDDVRLDATAIPEPSSFVLLGSATLLLMRRRIRRRA